MDQIRPFLIEKADLRGRFLRLSAVSQQLVAQHGYPAAVNRLLVEALGLTAALAAVLKFDGILTVQVKGDGPVSLLVCDAATDGAQEIHLRGYARFDSAALAALPEGERGAFQALMGQGYLAFTVDQGQFSERYQGIVALSDQSLLDSVLHYFMQSDQFLMGLRLASNAEGDVAAITLQRLPREGGHSVGTDSAEEADDAWRRANILLNTVTDAELLGGPDGKDIDADLVLFRLFHEDGVRVFEPVQVRAQCRCSAERLENVLRSLSADDIAAAQDAAGSVTANCEFCGRDYAFSAERLAELRG